MKNYKISYVFQKRSFSERRFWKSFGCAQQSQEYNDAGVSGKKNHHRKNHQGKNTKVGSGQKLTKRP